MVGKFERRKDTVQELTESAANHVGSIAMIIAGGRSRRDARDRRLGVRRNRDA